MRAVVDARRLLVSVGGAATASMILVLGGVQPAMAEEPPDISDATETITELAPELLAETSVNAPVEVVDSTQTEAPLVVVQDADQEVDVTASDGVSFTVDYATTVEPEVDGLTVLGTADEGVSAYIQPIGTGVRILTAIGDDDAPAQYSYSFDVPDGTSLVKGAGAFYLEHGSDVLGTIQQPWAIDAAGEPVPTSYTWADNSLTQHVDLSSPSITYPVLMDPAWTYSFQFDTTKSPSKNQALLKKCFNCYFPVSGAPKAFPRIGQKLPLTALGLNFECKFKNVYTGPNYFGFQFDATRKHIDMYGSNIIFEFKVVGGVKRLIVSAYIVNDSLYVKNAFYLSGAVQMWSEFASNLNEA